MPQSSSTRSDLQPFFTPQGVAVIGASATPGKLGYGVLYNLMHNGYGGGIYPVNPQVPAILDLPCYPDIAAVPDPVDLAVIIIAAAGVPAALAACGRRGIRGVIVMSGGFAETGPEGRHRQEELLAIARDYGIRLIGPNCVGVLDAHSGLNVTFLEQMPDPGYIAFLSQSGGIGGAIVDWAKGQGLGLSYFASLGNTADVTETEIMAWLAGDARTGVIALYIEGLPEGREFLQVAGQVGRHKPIVAFKAGGTEAGMRAVSSHTANLAGSEAVYGAAFRQSGVLVAESIEDLFGIALGLAYQPPPAGPRVAVLSNAGGPGVVAADALSRRGLIVAQPDEPTLQALRAALGPAPQLVNPIDLLGAASTTEFEAAARILLASPSYDALLAILVPNTTIDLVGVADGLARAAAGQHKPVYACLMGDISIGAGRQRLHEHRLPPYPFPEGAARSLAAAWTWQRWRETTLPQRAMAFSPAAGDAGEVRVALHRLRAAGRTTLGEADLYPLLTQLGLPVAPALPAASAEEAAACAGRVGYPVALKVVSPDLVHKSDAGGVLLGLGTADAVASGYATLVSTIQAARKHLRIEGVLVQRMAAPGIEVLVGVRHDPTFGPVVVVGGGGVYVELMADVALAVAPIGPMEARAMVAETRIGRLLAGARGRPPADIDKLVDLIVRLSALAALLPDLVELECNPVLVHPAGRGVTIVDVRGMLRPSVLT